MLGPDAAPPAARRDHVVAQPVVHFEIIGSDPQALRAYYAQLFGWQYDTVGVVAEQVSDPNDYGFIAPAEAGVGIPGGVGGGPAHRPRAMFYVGVADVEAALQQAESLGGHRVFGPVGSPDGPTVGMFTDPEGNLIGVAAAL
jgi:predicted enzyme related to lactoylglutathione lyase